jgi:tetratricopeptide (TPR) repeat protein
VSGVDDVTRKLRSKIGESLKSVQASPALEQVTTSSYEALRAYTEGTRVFDLERNFPKAIPSLQRAVALDTGFATAWRKLGTAYSNAHHPSSEVDFALTKAFQFRARLSENERYLTEAYYYYRGPGHDRQRAIAAYQALLDRGDSVYAANNLAVVYSAMQQTAKAESLFRLAIRKSPDNLIPVPNLGGVLLTEGKRAQFDSIIAVNLKRAPGSPDLVDLSLSPLYLDKQYDRYEHAIDTVRLAATSPEVHDMAAWRTSLILEVRGRLNEAERRFHESVVESAKAGAASPVIADSTTMALFDAWFRNRPERAVQRIDAAVAANPLNTLAERDRPLTDLATAYAVAGRPDRAQVLLAQFAQLKDTAYVRSRAGDVHAALAEVAIAEKRPRDAVTEFRRSDKLPDGYSRSANSVRIHAQLGRAFDLANEPDSAIAELEAFLHAPFSNRMEDDAVFLAGAHKRLGELYDAKGDREKATAHLTAFVELWKNADAELQPSVQDAKKRLARLVAGERR